MALRAEEISSIIQREIERFGQPVQAGNVGTGVEVGDGIARAYGLTNVMASELVEIDVQTPNGPATVTGLAYNLEEESVGIIIMGPYTDIKEGDTVRATGRISEVPVGRELIGRVVNAL